MGFVFTAIVWFGIILIVLVHFYFILSVYHLISRKASAVRLHTISALDDRDAGLRAGRGAGAIWCHLRGWRGGRHGNSTRVDNSCSRGDWNLRLLSGGKNKRETSLSVSRGGKTFCKSKGKKSRWVPRKAPFIPGLMVTYGIGSLSPPKDDQEVKCFQSLPDILSWIVCICLNHSTNQHLDRNCQKASGTHVMPACYRRHHVSKIQPSKLMARTSVNERNSRLPKMADRNCNYLTYSVLG